MLVYKIQDKKSKLFSTGKGSLPTWAKGGKTWFRLNDLTTHMKYVKGSQYDDAEIVVFDCVEIKRASVKDKEQLKIRNL